MFAWYASKMAQRPFLTNVVSTGALFAAGDIIAQNFESSHAFDYPRALRATTYGAAIFAPVGYQWYKILASITGKSRGSLTVKRVLVDQLGFAPIVSIPLYYSSMEVMRGETSYVDIRDHVKANYMPTLWANWSVWPMVQLFNFYYTPPQFRFVVVNVVALAWNTFLSLRNSSHHKC